jgi:hypothetical protein
MNCTTHWYNHHRFSWISFLHGYYATYTDAHGRGALRPLSAPIGSSAINEMAVTSVPQGVAFNAFVYDKSLSYHNPNLLYVFTQYDIIIIQYAINIRYIGYSVSIG